MNGDLGTAWYCLKCDRDRHLAGHLGVVGLERVDVDDFFVWHEFEVGTTAGVTVLGEFLRFVRERDAERTALLGL